MQCPGTLQGISEVSKTQYTLCAATSIYLNATPVTSLFFLKYLQVVELHEALLRDVAWFEPARKSCLRICFCPVQPQRLCVWQMCATSLLERFPSSRPNQHHEAGRHCWNTCCDAASTRVSLECIPLCIFDRYLIKSL